MKKQGMFHLDALFSILIMILMVGLVLKMIAKWTTTINNMHKQQLLFDSLVLFSEYAIKECSSRTTIKGETFVEMNVLPSYDLDCFNNLAQTNANHILVSFSPVQNKLCIYRIVTINKKEIKKLYFCGDIDASV